MILVAIRQFRLNLGNVSKLQMNRWDHASGAGNPSSWGILAVGFLLFNVAETFAQSADATNDSAVIRVVEAKGVVEVRPAGSGDWVLTRTNQLLKPGWRLRTGPNSRASILWSDRSVLRFDELTEVEVLNSPDARENAWLNLARGALSFFHRAEPGRIRIISQGITASVEGTEFVMRSDPSRRNRPVEIFVLDGRVAFGNEFDTVDVVEGWQAALLGDGTLVTSRGILTESLLQWALYYPAVLDLDDLLLSDTERAVLLESMNAYRTGDLMAALDKFPKGRSATSAAERIYLGALLLGVGQVAKTELILGSLGGLDPDSREGRLVQALRTLIAAVRFDSRPASGRTNFATESLAASYYAQSRATGDESLAQALALAEQATKTSPEFGFAWARLADLRLSFGEVRLAELAIDESLRRSPRNAQSLAVKGFVLASRNDSDAALHWFNQAIAADPALANAWLGRGLARIRRGLREEGLEDLTVAAALEPQRALLRSYLGKAYGDIGDRDLADHELAIARRLDPEDPTAWLYSALHLQQGNRINEAILALEQSKERNDNRSMFRSRMLLDQDRAVRSANLASIYREAGMEDVSLGEAARAITYDYANSSAHLLVSDSFNALRDPSRFNLRHETVWFNELLLANLLAPAGAARLSQTIGQLSYSRLFESDHLGLASLTDVRSDKQLRQLAAQFGTVNDTSWALDLDYQHNEGVRPNNHLDRVEWYTTVKQQVTFNGSLLFLAKYQNFDAGDNFQYQDQTNFRPHFSFKERQDPILVGGYHHEWSPGIHTLMLGGRVATDLQYADRQANQWVLLAPNDDLEPLDVKLSSEVEIYTAELQQILQADRVTLIGGVHWQGGAFDSRYSMGNPGGPNALSFPSNAITGVFSEDFNRLKGYGYLMVEPLDRLWFTAGFSYDQLTMPDNFRHPPLSSGTDGREVLGPKAAMAWNPWPDLAIRAMYSRFMGGVSLDESFRLEPSQLVGFPQAFRTVISESVVGSVAAPEYDTSGGALDWVIGPRTYAGLQGWWLESSARRTIGVFRNDDSDEFFDPGTTAERLDYDEVSFLGYVNQLIGEGLAVGADYRFTDATLKLSYPEASAILATSPNHTKHSLLHRLGCHALYNHSSGLFSRVDVGYYLQSNEGPSGQRDDNKAVKLPGDGFVQVDWSMGWRFARRKGEVALGILNLTDANYRLNPLTYHPELPRERVYFARLSFQF
jgi:tetratricopeptide (TPR) repeat protein